MGFEPATYGLQNRCSTVELHQHESVTPIKDREFKFYRVFFSRVKLLADLMAIELHELNNSSVDI